MAKKLLTELQSDPVGCHVLLPELVVHEFQQHLSKQQLANGEHLKWVQGLLETVKFMTKIAEELNLGPAQPITFQTASYSKQLIGLATTLSQMAIHLERNLNCISRAVDRLMKQSRPSHSKSQIKDSIILEHCLEVCSLLNVNNLQVPRVFISSNTVDYADSTRRGCHADLTADFTAANLSYETSIQAALGKLASTQP